MTTEVETVPRRDTIVDRYLWDLSGVYADDALWERDIVRLEDRLPALAALRGRLGQSAQSLLAALRLRDQVGIQLARIQTYASHARDVDSADPAAQARDERAEALAAKVHAALAFIEPDIVAIPRETIAAWLRQEPELQLYAYYLEQLDRRRAHVRSAEVEAVLAQFADLARTPGEAYETLTYADLRFPTIADEADQPVQLSMARYGRLLESSDRRVRRDAFTGLSGAFRPLLNTLGVTLAAEVRARVAGARMRGYASTLDAALQPEHIPTDVYHNLIATVNANLPLLHRYMALRGRILGLADQRYYDLSAPLLPSIDLTVSYAEAVQTITEALATLGADYAEALQQAFRDRWIDVYENIGKRSGAYSGGSYATAPFILLNYQGRIDDMFILAHELGHSMHSFFTRRTQPFVYGEAAVFVAEVASTLNEVLLTHYLRTAREDPLLRKQLIVQQLQDMRIMIFRQTMFAEFELDMHTRSAAGEPLTADALTRRYYELIAHYHGPAITLDEEVGIEWARIPHFYYNFYVYQYATGLSAALALSKQILAGGQPEIDRYLGFLSSGSSRPSIDILRDAGVDMTTPAPIQDAMDYFGALLDELELELTPSG